MWPSAELRASVKICQFYNTTPTSALNVALWTALLLWWPKGLLEVVVQPHNKNQNPFLATLISTPAAAPSSLCQCCQRRILTDFICATLGRTATSRGPRGFSSKGAAQKAALKHLCGNKEPETEFSGTILPLEIRQSVNTGSR